MLLDRLASCLSLPPLCHTAHPPDPSHLLVSAVQAELEELVKKEHARIDSQDKSSPSTSAAGEQSVAGAAAATTEAKKEE